MAVIHKPMINDIYFIKSSIENLVNYHGATYLKGKAMGRENGRVTGLNV